MKGIENETDMQGRSLFSLLRGEETGWRSEFFYEHLFEHPRIPKTEAVRTERWKYIRHVDQEPVYEQLFDLRNDPKEIDNIRRSFRNGDLGIQKSEKKSSQKNIVQ